MLVRPLSILLPSESALEDVDQHVSDAKTSFDQMRSNSQYKLLEDHILIYRITDSNRSCTGIILGVDTAEFTDDKIVHHESTIPHKVAKQTTIAKEQGGLSKPIILTNRAIPSINEIIARYTQQAPLVDTHLQKYSAQHQLWSITDHADMKTIIDAFAAKEKGYIVDGHHRTRAIQALSVDPSVNLSTGLCGMFDIEQLEILPFHRIVDIDMPIPSFLQGLSTIGILEPLTESKFPSKSNEIVILVDDQYYSFTWPIQEASTVDQLDVNLLSNTILRDLLDIDNESTSTRVEYLEGNHTRKTIASKIKGTGKVAFLLQGISTEVFIDILNDGHVLPPKSTFFLPRMANGIISMAWK